MTKPTNIPQAPNQDKETTTFFRAVKEELETRGGALPTSDVGDRYVSVQMLIDAGVVTRARAVTLWGRRG